MEGNWLFSKGHGLMTPTSAKTHLDDCVTQHMKTDVAKLRQDQSVEQSLAAVRALPPEGRIIYFYAVDELDRLVGIVPTRRLLLADRSSTVQEIMDPKAISIAHTATVLDACEFFLLHRFLAFPVVDDQNRVLGIVDVELYTDEIFEIDKKQDNDDLFQLIGVHLNQSQQASAFASFKSRFPWLIANICGGILAALITGFFEVELQRAVALALFIPVVLALAESVSIQSVSIALQNLHGPKPTWQAIWQKLKLESGTGVMLGAACAVTVALVALLWLWQPVVSISVLGGILGGVTMAAMIGVAIPNLLHKFKLEPQVAAGPMALALTDMVTLVVYFAVARLLLG